MRAKHTKEAGGGRKFDQSTLSTVHKKAKNGTQVWCSAQHGLSNLEGHMIPD